MEDPRWTEFNRHALPISLLVTLTRCRARITGQANLTGGASKSYTLALMSLLVKQWLAPISTVSVYWLRRALLQEWDGSIRRANNTLPMLTTFVTVRFLHSVDRPPLWCLNGIDLISGSIVLLTLNLKGWIFHLVCSTLLNREWGTRHNIIKAITVKTKPPFWGMLYLFWVWNSG